jgi:hypothetical protein
MNWINSWKSSNKKNKIDFTFRFGWLTIWEIKWCTTAVIVGLIIFKIAVKRK